MYCRLFSILPIHPYTALLLKIIADEFKKNGRVSIRQIYSVLMDKPYGFMPCNLSVFVLAFVLKEYAVSSFTYTDGLTNDVMSTDKLRLMIDEVIKLQNTPNPRYKDKFIVTMTPEERKFSDVASDVFGIQRNLCTSIEQTRERIRDKMKGLSFPSFIMEFTIGIITFVYNFAIVHYGFGEIGLAAYLVIGYLMLIILTLFLGMAQGLQPVFSYFMGTGEEKRSKSLLGFSIKAFLAIGILCYVLIVFFSRGFFTIFNPGDIELINFMESKSLPYFSGFFLANLKSFTGDSLIELMSKITKVAEERHLQMLQLDADHLTAWIEAVIQENNLKAIMFIWDEFTEYFRNNMRSLTGFQRIVDLSSSAPFYMLIVTHDAMHIFPDGDKEFGKIKGRFIDPICEISLRHFSLNFVKYKSPRLNMKWGSIIKTLKMGPSAVANAAPAIPIFNGYINTYHSIKAHFINELLLNGNETINGKYGKGSVQPVWIYPLSRIKS